MVTLTDVTASTWTTLSNPPNGTAVPTEPSGHCLRDVGTCKKETADRVNAKAHFSRNRDWNPRPLPNISKPIAWPFLKSPIFRRSAFAKWDVLNLAFVPQPVAGYTVKIYKVTYGTRGDVPPQFVAVAFPMDLDISKPPPFLVHYKHVPGQAKEHETRFVHFRPFGWDWLYFDIWNWFVYNAPPPGTSPGLLDMPFQSSQQFSFGFPYQLRQANKQYVIVLPQISREFGADKQLRDYQLYSASVLREVLVAIQKDILSLEENTLSHVAISANSSGCQVFAKFLVDNIAAAARNPATETFMNDELNEVFILDPGGDFVDGMIAPIGRWMKLSSRRGGFKGKCVRFYSHGYPRTATVLTGEKSNPFTRGRNGFWESPARTVSMAYLPFDRSGDDVWQQTYDESQPDGRLMVNNFGFVHHVIPALCLTDAAARSLYV